MFKCIYRFLHAFFHFECTVFFFCIDQIPYHFYQRLPTLSLSILTLINLFLAVRSVGDHTVHQDNSPFERIRTSRQCLVHPHQIYKLIYFYFLLYILFLFLMYKILFCSRDSYPHPSLPKPQKESFMFTFHSVVKHIMYK